MKPKATETNDASSLDAVRRLGGLVERLLSVDSYRLPTLGLICVAVRESVPANSDETCTGIEITSEAGRNQNEKISE